MRKGFLFSVISSGWAWVHRLASRFRIGSKRWSATDAARTRCRPRQKSAKKAGRGGCAGRQGERLKTGEISRWKRQFLRSLWFTGPMVAVTWLLPLFGAQ